MTLFFFNFWDHKAYVPDAKGIELPNLNAVREQALKTARQILKDGLAQGDDRSGWKFDVKDITDVLIFPFSEALRQEPGEER